MGDFREYLAIAEQAAIEGGQILMKYWGNLKQIAEKGFPGDLVTEADKESEKQIIAYLKKRCPAHQILSEEFGWHSLQKEEFLWVVDPLDGTTNYSHQYPVFCVSIGLLFQGRPIVGVIYHPMQKEMFKAAEGLGATLNERRIHVSQVDSIQQSLLASGFAYDRRETKDNNYAEFCHLTQLSQGVRRAGSAALDLANVAAGRFDGYWERGVKIWDVAAGTVLVREAGGRVTSYDLGEVDFASERILATNGLLHEAISQELMQIKSARV